MSGYNVIYNLILFLCYLLSLKSNLEVEILVIQHEVVIIGRNLSFESQTESFTEQFLKVSLVIIKYALL